MIQFLLSLILIVTLPLGGYVYWTTRDLPQVSYALKEGALNPTKWTQVLGNDGTPILSYGRFHQRQVRLKDVSPNFVNALLAIEDRRFYQHMGIDPVAVGRAIVQDIVHQKFLEGGSTLTQQLARNVFLSNERSIRRKIREAFLAFKLEQELSKEQILTLYLNNIYFGEGAYGLEAASEIYFNKKPAQLSVTEAAMLAGMPQAPSQYSPFHNPKAALKRRNEVLAAMASYGKLEKSQLEEYQHSRLRVNEAGREMASSDRAPYFNRFVMNQIMQQFGLDEQGFWQSGMKIYTTLDPYAQALAARSLREQSKMYGRNKVKEQAALVSLDPSSGAIVAYVGGKDYQASQFDRVVQALRSPGSLFKIFTYTAAVDAGYEPNRVYLDEPIHMGDWSPKNYDGQHHGYMTMARALSTSNNVVAVKVMKDVGAQTVVNIAQRMGLNANMDPNLTLTLGGTSVSLLDMTAAFSVLANQGVRVEPFAIEKIVDRDRKVIYQHQPLKTDVLNRQTVDTMVSMMMGVVERGTGRAASIGRPMAGKTGTSDDQRDGWFIGFTPDVITGVWVGNDDNSEVPHLTGGGLPAVIWRTYMRAYLNNRMISNFDLQYGKALDPDDYSQYRLENLSETESNNGLTEDADRPLPTSGEGDLEADPALSGGPLPQNEDPKNNQGTSILPGNSNSASGNSNSSAGGSEKTTDKVPEKTSDNSDKGRWVPVQRQTPAYQGYSPSISTPTRGAERTGSVPVPPTP